VEFIRWEYMAYSSLGKPLNVGQKQTFPTIIIIMMKSNNIYQCDVSENKQHYFRNLWVIKGGVLIAEI